MELTKIFLAFLCIGVSYSLGSFPSGFIAGKWLKGIDLRKVGSGSTGATNVLRHVGKKAALIVFLIDVSKGIGSILIAKSLFLSPSFHVICGIAALSGHIWPIWLNWKGGKAVATGLGVFLGISWQVGLASLGIFMAVLSSSKIVSLSSISAAISLPILMFLSLQEASFLNAYIIASFAAMIMVLWRHRANLKRLLNGDEPRIGKIN
ncbi:glycerol-3-phosphate 1-O-acyltransferase PlsY [Prochlorococcus marinus]|uniref:Glycerol-3-phosphate acyltransferase n=1 Tax=Prochlorococcus marinus (strain MIT 9211) TaxID=93059 RepID=PLSY_PROM4|nr:glycerol-3-phosphate 1-O-acyltransferase PlsY [Prochlorococcus marinus]A9BBV0.1 RecName: Full=Glycerol-3-phosphate acyltransferase; AltName: Full=Acyl-PO4 G3P acyltransferase; AltName: Full=Acyl-phosphate--glycerol-3-phosphate acyltransferase; AltName: Full=G3P acyltransferase; Short=GPAT; AltName: Full=Lysophosphatidic acid synthase; Short=LPA synthase [Prochlorococcus marinus str. MIT 9211]ABX09312.1 Predicted membrane protein [Prochlorococcus marinus str. MIT 9211]